MQGSGGFLNTNQHAGPPHYTIGVTTESRTKKMRNATLLKKIILRKQDHRILYHKESGKRFVASVDDKRKIENRLKIINKNISLLKEMYQYQRLLRLEN